MLTSRNELNSRFRRSCCYKCGSTGHHFKGCRKSLPRFQPTPQRPEGQGIDSTLTQIRKVACARQMSRSNGEKDSEIIRMDTLELKTGKKVKLFNGAYMAAKIKDNLPAMSGKEGNKNVSFCEIADATEQLFKERGGSRFY